jgi:hypothetical protein
MTITPPQAVAAVEPPERGADGFYHPASEEELVALVLKAGREKCQCRVRGAAHSVSHAIYTDPLEGFPNRTSQQTPPEPGGRETSNIDIMLDRYRDMRVTDPARKIVEADAGIHLGADPSDPTGTATVASSLLSRLWERGWTLSNLGGITHQTVSGFTATGSSGASVQFSVNDDIWGFRVIDASGTVHELSRDDADTDLFHSMSPNLGLLGVVSKISFKCVDAYNISGEEAITREDACAIDLFGDDRDGRPSLEEFLRETPYTRLVWWPQRGAERVQVWQARRLAPEPGFEPHPFEEFTSHPEISEVAISVLYTLLGNLDDLSRTRYQFARTKKRIREILRSTWPLRGLGPLGTIVAWLLGGCAGIAISITVALLKPVAPFIERRIPRLFPKLLAAFIKLDSEKKGDEKGQPQRFRDFAWTGLPMDNEADDVLLPTGFTEIWLPLPRTADAMRVLRRYFREVESDRDGYARTGLYGWELYAAKPTPFWMSASHSDGADEWKDGVFRIDPYWFAANPGDPAKTFYPGLWDALRESGIPFRLHWGKYQPSSEEREWVDFFRSHYPRWDDFLRLREQRDPAGTFLTSYWKERFGL